MASPVLLGTVCASGGAQVAVSFTEAKQNLRGVVGKAFETSSLVPERSRPKKTHRTVRPFQGRATFRLPGGAAPGY